jgi:hypothetical protein
MKFVITTNAITSSLPSPLNFIALLTRFFLFGVVKNKNGITYNKSRERE